MFASVTASQNTERASWGSNRSAPSPLLFISVDRSREDFRISRVTRPLVVLCSAG